MNSSPAAPFRVDSASQRTRGGGCRERGETHAVSALTQVQDNQGRAFSDSQKTPRASAVAVSQDICGTERLG